MYNQASFTSVFSGDDAAAPSNYQPITGDFVSLTCWNFTYGDWQRRQFFSPLYPMNYPNRTECMQVLVGETRT